MTTYEQIQFFPLPELRNRARTIGDNVKSIKIYSGDRGRKGPLVYEIRRGGDGEFPDAAFDYFEGRYNGIYTAIFSPGGETMYLESTQQPTGNYVFNYDYLQGTPTQQFKGFRPEQFIERILQLERENAELKNEIEDLSEELKQFETLSGKFQHAIVNVFTNNILPLFSGEAQPMQGTPNYNQQQLHTNNNMNWQTHPIVVPGQEDQTLDNALDVLIAAFGENNIVRIAQKIQQQPQLVNTLTAML
jgi:hypothetical protein